MTFSIFSISIIIGIVVITCKTNMSGFRIFSGGGGPKDIYGRGGSRPILDKLTM